MFSVLQDVCRWKRKKKNLERKKRSRIARLRALVVASKNEYGGEKKKKFGKINGKKLEPSFLLLSLANASEGRKKKKPREEEGMGVEP